MKKTLEKKRILIPATDQLSATRMDAAPGRAEASRPGQVRCEQTPWRVRGESLGILGILSGGKAVNKKT